VLEEKRTEGELIRTHDFALPGTPNAPPTVGFWSGKLGADKPVGDDADLCADPAAALVVVVDEREEEPTNRKR